MCKPEYLIYRLIGLNPRHQISKPNKVFGALISIGFVSACLQETTAKDLVLNENATGFEPIDLYEKYS